MPAQSEPVTLRGGKDAHGIGRSREDVRPERQALDAIRGIISGDLRAHNRRLVIEEAFRRETVSRGELTRATGLTGAAISRITRELIDIGLLNERFANLGQARPGRPTRALELRPGWAFVVGVGIGAYEQSVQIADLRGRCVARRPLHLRSLRSAKSALAKVAREVRALSAKKDIDGRRIIACGVAMAGLVDPKKGTVIQSPNLGWQDVPVGEILARALGAPVYVDAMHHALNLANGRRSSARAENVVLVNAAMGIGSSVMLRGKILRGNHAAAGQIGHMSVAGARELCTCGRRGCLDTVASGYAVLRRLGMVPVRTSPKEHGVRDAQRLLRILRQTSVPTVRKALFEAGRCLGQALNTVDRVLDVDRFVLAGPLSQAESYVDGVKSSLESVAHSRLSVSSLSADNAAAWIALERSFLSATLDLSRLRP